MEPQKQLAQQVIVKAMKDEGFRNQLIKDPKLTLEQEFGMKFPDSMNVNVVEEDAQTIYLVLPPNPSAGTDQEIDDGDLESVAGGTWTVGNTSEYTCIPCQL